MAEYDFGLLNVPIAEDNAYMQSLLRTVLRAVGVGNVVAVKDGGEAIKLMRRIKEDPQEAGLSTVDILFTNWQMEPVDGVMVLKCVRRHKESLDRFLPVIMVSGFGDRDRVQEARELGVTEFVAKPYSIDALMARVMSVVDAPRQFVLTEQFFGPDRRRRPVKSGQERRVITKEEVEVIYDDR